MRFKHLAMIQFKTKGITAMCPILPISSAYIWVWENQEYYKVYCAHCLSMRPQPDHFELPAKLDCKRRGRCVVDAVKGTNSIKKICRRMQDTKTNIVVTGRKKYGLVLSGRRDDSCIGRWVQVLYRLQHLWRCRQGPGPTKLLQCNKFWYKSRWTSPQDNRQYNRQNGENTSHPHEIAASTGSEASTVKSLHIESRHRTCFLCYSHFTKATPAHSGVIGSYLFVNYPA